MHQEVYIDIWIAYPSAPEQLPTEQIQSRNMIFFTIVFFVISSDLNSFSSSNSREQTFDLYYCIWDKMENFTTNYCLRRT